MRVPSNAEWLNLWESGAGLLPFEQALLLLGAACNEDTPAALCQLSIGERDRRLLELRTLAFGPDISAFTECPQCREPLELVFGLDVLLTPRQGTGTDVVEYDLDAYHVHARLPNSNDLAYAANQPDPGATLLARCIFEATQDGEACVIGDLPAPVISAVEEQFAGLDPLVEIRVRAVCPACSHEWSPVFDVVSFFWRELREWSVRMLHQVHALAAAYGWSEAEILNLSPQRRQIYLEIIGGA